MAVRKKPAPVETEAENPAELAAEPEAVVTDGRRRYRALADFEVQLGETRLLFHKGRAFSTDEIPFDPRVMEPLD